MCLERCLEDSRYPHLQELNESMAPMKLFDTKRSLTVVERYECYTQGGAMAAADMFGYTLRHYGVTPKDYAKGTMLFQVFHPEPCHITLSWCYEPKANG